jgi:uncharacterized protein YegL
MRNEQLQGKSFKQSTQQRQKVDTNKTTAYGFISFIMRDVKPTCTAQTTQQRYEENTKVAQFANTDTHSADLTVFQLSEEEILWEMLSHLQADCPVMMQNKEYLIEKISMHYDSLNMKKDDSTSSDRNETCAEDAD